MPELKKNSIHTITIDRYASDGQGIGRLDWYPGADNLRFWGAAGRDLSGLADEGGQVLRLGTGGEDLGKIPRSHPLRLSPLPHLRRLHPAAHDL